jgi:peptidoglycan/LPS O-acetylase OafA/YrhL
MSVRAGSTGPLPVPIEAAADMAVAAPGTLRPGLFENINLLRAFAALWVVVYHVIEHGRWASFPIAGPLATLRVGWLGVDLFFVISGFVITYSALALHRKDPSDFSRQYWVRRLSRILPLYLLTLGLWIVVLGPPFFARPTWTWQIFTHLAFIHSFWPETHGALDGANWTLAIEMQFYLAVALLIPWIQRTPAWRIWAYGIVIAWAWRAAMFVLYGPGDPYLSFVHVSQFPGALDEFCAGIFLAKLVVERRESGRAEPLIWLGSAVVTGYVTMSIYAAHPWYWESPGMVIFWRTAFAAFIFCVVAAAVRLPQAIATRWLRPFNYLGEISYGIYLWHLFAVQLFIHMLGLRQIPALVAVTALTILTAAGSWHCFERPFIALARR